MKLFLFFLTFVTWEVLGSRTRREAKPYKMVCYWDTKSISRTGDGQFLTGDIDASLCTHLVVMSARLGDDHLLYFPSGFQPEDIPAVLDLKNTNQDLRVLLSVDDLSESARSYLNYPDFESFQYQLLSVLDVVLKNYDFDGIDLDLSKPDVHGATPDIKQHIIDLLQGLRTDLSAKGLLLTALVSADKYTADIAYDIPQIDHLVDFTNLMSFDYHGGSEQYTGLNAPMYARPDETGDEQHLNVDWTVQHWLDAGATAGKTVLGVAAFGRTFTLSDPKQTGVGAPVRGYGKAGPYLKKAGFQAYNELCDSVANHGWYVNWETTQEVPYAYMDDQWIGYDDVGSVDIKGKYAGDKGLAGAMLWTIDMDDFRANCDHQKFPLMTQLYHTMEEHEGFAPYPGPDPHPGPGPQPGPQPYPPVCVEPGYMADSQDCTKFHRCVDEGGKLTMYHFNCGPGTVFNPKFNNCDWPYNVPQCNY